MFGAGGSAVLLNKVSKTVELISVKSSYAGFDQDNLVSLGEKVAAEDWCEITKRLLKDHCQCSSDFGWSDFRRFDLFYFPTHGRDVGRHIL